ncbi:subtilisin-like protease SBT4.13 [Corylus avellana]|uniref:subtilisin-like protease SBT4.13 n=1 Tax=Corylus avellana TaxID=13451 RepID=UPI00286A90E0|nr:subtilisin-like protease SBT4.13 [Corylus avellana]
MFTMAAVYSYISQYCRILVFLIVAAVHVFCCGASDEGKDVYIVYMGSLLEGEYSTASLHLSVLQQVLGESSATGSHVKSYTRSFNAFAARLSDEEHQIIASRKEVVSVFPSRTLQLQTTRSWDFMGLTETVKRNPTVESDVIVGVIDSGIWPESESFRDSGYGPPPAKWKGTCAGGSNFTCNNKLIGARVYNGTSARDIEGHGTHTASTAAGIKVSGASFFGLAEGKARGGVPSARIAAYKACSEYGCRDQDILAAFDDAIADGVDLITISVGGDSKAFENDSIAIGSFHAMEKGILTVQAAGNNGPSSSTVGSVAPWLLSTAASSIDRKIIDKVVLGNGKTLIGNGISSFTQRKGKKFPMIHGKDASTTSCANPTLARVCSAGCLNSSLVKGKIVVCDWANGWGEAFRAGAVGSITLDNIEKMHGFNYVLPLPTSTLTAHKYGVVKTYVNSTKNPQGNILKSEVTKNSAAPVVASFSSRGPNLVAPDILKPDITAPGIEILASYSPVSPPSGNPKDKRSAKYSIMSGTSMSCPHAAGAAAYVKTFHPDWSPSAIKSALMTTAWPMNATKEAEDEYREGEFAFGAGHVNPVKAIDPGLVYETSKDDYIKMLCSMQLSFFGTCPSENKGSPKDLNYPSMQVRVETGKSFAVEFPRTVTNVGLANSTFVSKVITDSQMNVSVKPSILSFKSLKEKKSFVVIVSGKALPSPKRVSAALVWSDRTHIVRSPIVVYTSFL